MAFKTCSANSGVYTVKGSVLIKQAISSFALGLLLETLKVDSFKMFFFENGSPAQPAWDNALTVHTIRLRTTCK